MEITLIQGLMLSVMAVIVGLDFFLEAFFIFRPLIVSTLTGLILGELETGLKVGALIELAFAGLTPAGGTQPPNPGICRLNGHSIGTYNRCFSRSGFGIVFTIFIFRSVCYSILLFCLLFLYGKSR